ncbi:MAG TPA: hypothetical protein VFS10_17460 [Pyrinomonadaceae bacterium]|nr:hypothetical protein [Pyrinomonadaceae bacterium]
MKFPVLRLLCGALCPLTLLMPSTESDAQTKAPGAATNKETVVFAVKKYEATQTMEPVVIVRRGVFVKPPVDESDVTGGDIEAQSKRFINEYFRAGRQYRLLFGGGDSGTVTVRKYLEPGCVSMVAEVKAETQARLGGEVQALAVSSDTVGRGRQSSRRAPTEAERASALELVRAAFARNAVPAALVKKMETLNLTASDLDRDGRAELVGSFRAVGPDYTNYALFMIFEPAGDKFKPALTWYHKGAEADAADRRLVDLLDLDGDGVAEVFAEGHYYESNDYFIYKKQRGQWRSVYQGGGGGC